LAELPDNLRAFFLILRARIRTLLSATLALALNNTPIPQRQARSKVRQMVPNGGQEFSEELGYIRARGRGKQARKNNTLDRHTLNERTKIGAVELSPKRSPFDRLNERKKTCTDQETHSCRACRSMNSY
jgi:hypothetical protein